MPTLAEIFPPYALTVTCGPLRLRVLRDDDIPELVELIRDGVVDPSVPLPVQRPWPVGPYALGEPDRIPARNVAWWWSQRTRVSPDAWELAFVVRRDGVAVGVQDVRTDHYRHTRSAETGSWLGLRHQGQGTGTLARQAVVGLMVDHLGAVELRSSYLESNLASAAVSRKTGYVPNGQQRRFVDHDGGYAVTQLHVRVTPETFIRPPHPIEVEGVEAVRRFLALD